MDVQRGQKEEEVPQRRPMCQGREPQGDRRELTWRRTAVPVCAPGTCLTGHIGCLSGSLSPWPPTSAGIAALSLGRHLGGVGSHGPALARLGSRTSLLAKGTVGTPTCGGTIEEAA